MSNTNDREEPKFFLGVLAGLMVGIGSTMLFAGAAAACGVIP